MLYDRRKNMNRIDVMTASNRNRLLYIRRILETETDESPPITINELLKRLSHLRIEGKRRAAQSNIE